MRQLDTPAGKYRHRATLMRIKAGATVNAAGHVNEKLSANWEPFTKRWCEVESRPGRESLVGDQVTEVATHVLRFRSDSVTRAMTTTMQAKIGARLFNFSSPPVDVDELRREVEVPAIEVK